MAIILNIGLFDKDTKQQELDDKEVIEIISKYFDCTIIPCYGVYTHQDGTKIIEPSLKVEVYNKRFEECYWIVKKLLKELNQESIVLSDENNLKFVNSDN